MRTFGFVSSLSTRGIEKLHSCYVVFCRQRDVPEKHGRAHLFSVEAEAGSIFLADHGIHLVYGADDRKVARLMRSRDCGQVVAVMPKRPTSKSQVRMAIAQLSKRSIPVEIITIKKTGAMFAKKTAGTFLVDFDLDQSKHPTAAPSTPPREVETAPHMAPSAPPKDVPQFVHSAPSAPPRDVQEIPHSAPNATTEAAPQPKVTAPSINHLQPLRR